MKITLAVMVAALVIVGAAAASYQPVYWTLANMKTAVRAIGYPHPRPTTLSCTRITMSALPGSTFRCTATYASYPKSRFVISGVGQGGWLCGGGNVSTCKLLRRGFVTSGAVTANGSLAATADISSRGWLVNHNRTPYTPNGFCRQGSTSLIYVCAFMVNDAAVRVTIVFRAAKGGYVVTGALS